MRKIAILVLLMFATTGMAQYTPPMTGSLTVNPATNTLAQVLTQGNTAGRDLDMGGNSITNIATNSLTFANGVSIKSAATGAIIMATNKLQSIQNWDGTTAIDLVNRTINFPTAWTNETYETGERVWTFGGGLVSLLLPTGSGSDGGEFLRLGGSEAGLYGADSALVIGAGDGGYGVYYRDGSIVALNLVAGVERLNYSDGTTAIDLVGKTIMDGAGLVSINPATRYLYAEDGTSPVLKWQGGGDFNIELFPNGAVNETQSFGVDSPADDPDMEILEFGNQGAGGLSGFRVTVNRNGGESWVKLETVDMDTLDMVAPVGISLQAPSIVFNAGGEQFTVTDGEITPLANNDFDIGTTGNRFKDGYFAGTNYVDAVVIGTNKLTASTGSLLMNGAAVGGGGSGDLTAITGGNGIVITSGTGPIPDVAVSNAVVVGALNANATLACAFAGTPNQMIAQASANTNINFLTEYDPNNLFDLVNDKYTTPSAGDYEVAANTSVSNAVAAQIYRLSIFVNSAQYTLCGVQAAGAFTVMPLPHPSVVLTNLASGDVIETKIFASQIPCGITSYTAPATYMTVKRIR